MTLEELQEAWVRWMHRNDIEADIATVTSLALQKVQQRLMYEHDKTSEFTENLIRTSSAMFLHAGLIYLHELAQDDEGGARETQLYEDAIRNHNFWNSLNTSDAQMVFPGEESI